MSSAPTLNSRLRVLVAKTFRAEKLYSSMRNAHAEKLGSPTALAQMANDIRAREWQRSHYQLRVALNDLISQGASASLTEELVQLRGRFLAKAEESLSALEAGIASLNEDSRRQEFAHIFKTSAELIRHKARAQASQVVVNELAAVLEASGRKISEAALKAADGARLPELEVETVDESRPARSNVIPLPRRAATGGRDLS